MSRTLKQVNGVWVPETENHMDKFLAANTVGGKGAYQFTKLQAAVGQCKRRRTAIDIGGHVGTWSMHLVKMFALVCAFEPHPLHREAFERNLADTPMVDEMRLYPYGLGAAEMDTVLSAGIDSTGDTWVRTVEEALNPNPAREYVPIHIRTLDSFGFSNVDFIKIDCEGYELAVLEGAKQTIAKCKPVIIVEQKPGHASRFGLSDTAACGYLEQMGMTLYKELVGDFIYTW